MLQRNQFCDLSVFLTFKRRHKCVNKYQFDVLYFLVFNEIIVMLVTGIFILFVLHYNKICFFYFQWHLHQKVLHFVFFFSLFLFFDCLFVCLLFFNSEIDI